MPALAARRPAYRRTPSFQAGLTPATPQGLPSAAMVDAVLRLADRREVVGGCRVRLSVSDLDKVDADTRRLLGRALARLTHISILWDEREEQIVRINQSAPRPSVFEDEEDAMWRERPALAAVAA